MCAAHYRPLRHPDECAAAALLVSHAFATPLPAATQWLESCGWSEIRVLVSEHGLAASLVRLPMAHYFGQSALATLGITGVAVALDQRRSGLGAELVRQALNEAREQGFCCSSLYASHHGFYRQLGYEHAAMRTKVNVEVAKLRQRDKSGALHLLTVQELAPVQALYREYAVHMPAFAARTPYLWHRLVQERNGLTPVVLLSLDERGVPDGYAIYRQSRTGQDFAQHLTIEDWVATSPQSIARLWGAVTSTSSLIQSLTYVSAANDPFFLASDDPLPRLGPAEPWLLRIIAVVAAIEQRAYPPWLRFTLRFGVHDPLFPDNRGPWRVEVKDGQAHVERVDEAELWLDVGAFAGLFSGHWQARSLIELGRARGETSELLLLAALFQGPAPWLRDFY